MSAHEPGDRPRIFTVSDPLPERPLSSWGSVATELLGTETRFYQGRRWRHRVIEAGAGDPLILIHGGGGHAETWARNMHTLGRHFRVYAIDALYHGLTSKEPYDDVLRHDLQVEALVDLMDAIGIEWAHFEGESMGAWNVFDVAMRHPERVGKVVLSTGIGRVALGRSDFADTGHDFHELARLSERSLLEPSFETVRERLQWLVAEPSRMTDDMIEIRLGLYRRPDVVSAMRKYFKAGQNAADVWNLDPIWTMDDIRERFKAKALVFWTEHNPGEGPDLGEHFASILPGSHYYLMKDAGHWPHWERPVEHDQVVTEFLLDRSA